MNIQGDEYPNNPRIIRNPPTNRIQFKQFINEHRNKIIFLKFYADWCKPCNECEPDIIEGFNNLKINNKLLVYVHFDKCRDIVNYYRVKAIPTVSSLKDGEPHNIIVGVDKRKLNFIFFDI
jgi:thioredoxin-like negative regulator of GroEL